MNTEENVIDKSEIEELQVETTQEQELRLTPEMIKTADVAIRVLMSSTDVGFKMGIFNDMNDVACINKSMVICRDFINIEIYKSKNYNKIICETPTEVEGVLTFNSEIIEIPFTPTEVEGINIGIVPDMKESILYMFYNGDNVFLKPDDIVYEVFGKLVPKSKTANN